MRRSESTLRYWAIRVLWLGVLLVVPVRAMSIPVGRFGYGWIVTYMTLVSVLTVLAFRADKEKAKRGAWRIPEKHLHLLESVGGWPSAYIAQRAFRHKIVKEDYQFAYWFIVIVHQYVAFDVMQDWRWTKFIDGLIQTLSR